MTHPHDRALEAAALAVAEETDRDGRDYYALKLARAAVSAYLAEAGDGRLSELERENAALREVVAYSRDAIDFYDKVQAASQDEKVAVGQDHWNWLIEAARRARAALAGSG